MWELLDQILGSLQIVVGVMRGILFGYPVGTLVQNVLGTSLHFLTGTTTSF